MCIGLFTFTVLEEKMTFLDDVAAMRRVDSQGMLDRIGELPVQCQEAWQNVQHLELPAGYRDVDRIAILGMGGSAISGDLTQGLVADHCSVPIVSVRDYTLPAWIGPSTLAVASSYSGNTEETLIAAEAAKQAGAKVVGLTSGGKLAQWCAQSRVPLIRFEYQSAPRAALGHSLTLLLGLLYRLGLAPNFSADLDEAVAVMRTWNAEINETVPAAENVAKQLAQRLIGRIPVMYGAGVLAAVARRWKTQFNENSKCWAFYDPVPEMNHNSIVGTRWPDVATNTIAAVFLTSAGDYPRNRLRLEITQDLLRQQGFPVEVIAARGESRLAQVLSLIHFGDYVSYYLAMLAESDPNDISLITY
ncbi:MAG TPA: bifunctional phosphoglucose/phosphomannose isomerase, partial [Anaerolineae bacterium]|nr:bifunctional phosphoglucose/phosphomannose isomerase [Anaerolineae bacterium]